jgi:RNA polymerase sigma factor for flagellar operon FliA
VTAVEMTRDAQILHHAPLVKWVVGRMAPRLPKHVVQRDLIATGLIGLMKALDGFDPERGVKFEPYAITRIRGEILDDLRSQDWVGRRVRGQARQLDLTRERLRLDLARDPTTAEVAEASGLPVDAVRATDATVASARFESLDAPQPTVDVDGDLIADTIPDLRPGPEQLLADDSARGEVREAVRSLPERQRQVVALYYFEHLTLREIGDVLGVTESRVCQVHRKALDTLNERLSRQRTAAGRRTGPSQTVNRRDA